MPLVALTLAGCLLIVGSVWLISHTGDDRLAFYLPRKDCPLLAVITPFLSISIRTQVRLTRIGRIDLFADLFKITGTGTGTGSGSGKVGFDFVRGRYLIDLPDRGGNRCAGDVPRFPMLLHAVWMLLFSAIPNFICSGSGIFCRFDPQQFRQAGDPISWLKPSLLVVGGPKMDILSDPAALSALRINTLLVASAARMTLS